MAAAMGDGEFAAHCRHLRAQGAKWTEEHLFNGSYYAQQVRPPADFANSAPRSAIRGWALRIAEHPEFQVGDGCLIDQLAGDVAARFAGVGSSFDAGHVTAALGSIRRLNHVQRLGHGLTTCDFWHQG